MMGLVYIRKDCYYKKLKENLIKIKNTYVRKKILLDL